MRFFHQYRWIWGLLSLTALGLVIAFSLPKKKGSGDCHCEQIPIEEAIAEADLIFIGRCTYATTNWIGGGMKYSFVVEKAWNKRCDNHMIVNSGWEQDCGFNFEEGKSYLVFANKKFTLQTNRCIGTTLLDSTSSAYLQLQELPNSEVSASPIAQTMIWTIAALGLLSLLLIGIVVFRSRFRQQKS